MKELLKQITLKLESLTIYVKHTFRLIAMIEQSRNPTASQITVEERMKEIQLLEKHEK